MKTIHRIISGCIFFALGSACAFAGDNSAGFDIFLLVGQSNMAGRGYIHDTLTDPDATTNPQVLSWHPGIDNGYLVTAKDPISHQEPGNVTKAGMGLTFGKAYLQHLKNTGFPNRRVLLVGAAYGGTSFVESGHRWIATFDPNVGGDLFRGAVDRANRAIQLAKGMDSTSSFKGILWHQGENDIRYGGGATYTSNHKSLMQGFRNHISGASSAPVVVGEMTQCFMNRCDPSVPAFSLSDRDPILHYFHNIQGYISKSAWVSSLGLLDNGGTDRIHFHWSAQRELGRLYFQRYLEAAQ